MCEMLVNKDAIGHTQDELFSDAYPVEDLPALYAVTAQVITTQGTSVITDLGSTDTSGSADDASDDAQSASVINLVDTHHLQKTGFQKRGYAAHLKDYLKAVEYHLTDHNPEARRLRRGRSRPWRRRVRGS